MSDERIVGKLHLNVRELYPSERAKVIISHRDQMLVIKRLYFKVRKFKSVMFVEA